MKPVGDFTQTGKGTPPPPPATDHRGDKSKVVVSSSTKVPDHLRGQGMYARLSSYQVLATIAALAPLERCLAR